MATVIYNQALRQSRMAAVITAVDTGTAASRIQIGTSLMTGATPPGTSILVTIDLDDPSFTQATPGVIEMDGVPLSGVATNDGTAALARIIDGNGAVVISGLTVGTSATTPTPEITLNAVGITTGQTVTLSTGSITHANNA